MHVVESDKTPTTAEVEAKNLQELKNVLDNYVKEADLQNGVSTTISERGVVVTLNDTLLFQSAKAYANADLVG